ncbi:MAG: TetR/AcrR family transcriptional regulator [Bacteroidota bacterium]
MRKKYEIEDIIQKSQEVIWRKGYHNTGINELLKESGIPKGSFYNFFESKEDLMIKIIDHYVKEQREIMIEILSNSSVSPLERLKQFYRHSIDQARNELDRFLCVKGCLINNTSVELGAINDNIAETINAHFGEISGYIAEVIREGQLKNEITDLFPAEQLVEFMQSNYYGTLSRVKTTRSIEPLELNYQMTFAFLAKSNP